MENGYGMLLRNRVYQIQGRLIFNQKYIENMPWGEVDWQSGDERWILAFYGLFNGKHAVETDITLLPETFNFIHANTIDWDDKFITFEALTVFANNPYFNWEILDISDLGLEGYYANGSREIVGDFKIIREIERTKLVNWWDEK